MRNLRDEALDSRITRARVSAPSWLDAVLDIIVAAADDMEEDSGAVSEETGQNKKEKGTR